MAAARCEVDVASLSYALGASNVLQCQSGPWGLSLTAVFSPGSEELHKVGNSKDRGRR
jgi:hypothetical protein